MKKRILSLVVTLVVAVSVILGVSIFASAENSDGLKQSAISLAENVTLKMEVAVAAPTDGAYAKITLPNGEVDATQLVASAPKNGDNYVFFAEVAVKDLAKDVTIEICDKDGATLVAPATTTALAYCDAYTAQGGEFNALVGALKDYANAADYYFDYSKTAEAAANADFSAVADVATSGKLPEGLTHRSATLLLESETTIRHYFELADGKKIENYVFFIDDNANGACDAGEKVVPASKKTSDDKTVYYVDIAGLTPNELDKVYTVGVIGVADGVAYTCNYGVLTYAKRVYANDAVDTKNLAAALLGYNTEAGKLVGTVKFVTDGSSVADMSYEYGVKAPINVASSKAGAIFAGWADANGTVINTIPGYATGTLTLTATWKNPVLTTDFVGGNQANKTRYVCYNHVDGDDADALCDTCKYCVDNEACVGLTTACETCGKKAVDTVSDSFSGWGSSKSDKFVGYTHKINLGGKDYQLIAKKSGTAYGTLPNTIAKLDTNVFAYTVELGIPSAEQYATVETKLNTTLPDTPMDFLIRALWNKADGSAGMDYFMYVQGGKVALTKDAKTGTIALPVGSTTTVTVIFDFGNAVKGDGASDPYTKYLIDANGNVISTLYTDPGVDLSNFDRNGAFAQPRTEGAGGRLLIGTYAKETVGNKILASDGSLYADYTPGEVTAIPAPAAKDGYTFGGWYADAALTQPIDAVAANVTGTVKVYPRWIQAAIYEAFDYAEDTMLIASQVYCDHVDADTNGICDKAECKRCLKHVDADVKDTEGYGICDVCGYKTARCGNAVGHHTDVHTLDGQKNIVAENVADKICDNCGLSNVDVGSNKLTANGAITYSPSGEWSTGYAKGVADENGGYLIVARENGDGPTVSYGGAQTIKNLLANSANKVLTYEFEIKKNGDAKVLGFAVRMRTSAGAVQFGTIAATTNGYVLDDEFVKVAIVVDYDAKEIRYYADGLYVSSAAYNYNYDEFATTGYGLLQMRLSGTGSICFDSIAVYTGDLYRIDAAAPACEHVDADDNLACDKCSKEFDDGCDHVTVNYTETKVSTLFAEGEETGYCAKCNAAVDTKAIAKTEEDVTEVSTSSSGTLYSKKVNVASTLPEGEHFYPTNENPDGNDLFVEFSFLWNETLANNKEGMIDFFRFEKADGSRGNTLYFMQFRDQQTEYWFAPYAGSFETGDFNADNGGIFFGPSMPDHYKIDWERESDYVFIGDYGWHRLGLQLHQDASIVDGKVFYDIIAYFYIDGVLVSAYHYAPLTDNLLYTAEIVNGELVCTDIASDRVVSYYKLRDKKNVNADESYYLITADEYVTAGHSFVLDAAPLANPIPGTMDLKGDVIDATQHFTFGECAHNNGEFTVKLATTFAEGSKTGVCADCGQQITVVLAKTDADAVVFTSADDGMYGERFSLKNHVLADGEHFYPTEDDPDGKSLIMEYSILWNESLADFALDASADYIYTGMVATATNTDRFTSYHLCLDNVTDFWCQHVGGFEPDSNKNIVYGPSMASGAAVDKFPNIGDYGWHRLGFKISQETKVENGVIKHHVTTSIYIDGVLISAYKWIRNNNESKLLYTASLVNGELVYSDSVIDAKCAFPFLIADVTADSGESVYFATADTYVTAGDDFVIDVEKAATPTSATVKAEDGTDLTYNVYYEVK